MKNVYFIQPSYHFDGAMYFPYAVGSLAAYAWKDSFIKQNYTLGGILHLREEIPLALSKLDSPAVAAFSNYLWNYEYNKALALEVRRKYPGCVIIFGGHQISENDDTPEDCPFADILIYGEGEEVFTRVLKALSGAGELSDVPNLAYRENGKIIRTEMRRVETRELPSPYTEGLFDDMMKEFPNANWSFFLESNRGCPYHCAYCDWGRLQYCDTQIPLERVLGDIDWMIDKKIEFCAAIDANFGILERDEQLIDHIIELNKTKGYPKKFQASYAKNKQDRIYRICKKLDEAGMNKGVTLAFQTMSPVAAENIGRKNISMGEFGQLIRQYASDGIPTYTELILGMPGETLESLINGIDSLLEAGQHGAIYVYNCEWLMQSEMGNPDYMEKFKVKYTKIPFCFSHMVMNSEDITEYSRIVTSTYSMSPEMWTQMNLFSYTVQCFHSMGILQLPAIYLRYEKNIAYRDFYSGLLRYLLDNPGCVAGEIFSRIKKNLCDILEGKGSLSRSYEGYGDILWTYEEYCYMEIMKNIDLFYEEISEYLAKFIEDRSFINQLLYFQKNMLKRPFDEDRKVETEYDFASYYKNALKGNVTALEKRRSCVELKKTGISSWEEFAVKIVWHSRRPGKNIYINDENMMKTVMQEG